MRIVLITGSGGLIGSASVDHFKDHFDLVIGLDNDMRAVFFGPDASTRWNVEALQERIAREHGFRLVDHRLELYGIPIKTDKN